jgi:Zn-dependent protease with chaperone function
VRRARLGLIFLACAALWALAAHRLWRTSVPAGLRLGGVHARSLFSGSFLSSSSSYEQFLDFDALLGSITLLAVLAVYARHGHRFMRESAAGRIGTGMLLGMLGFALVWLAEIPFSLAAVWWERRHGVSHQGYVAALVEGFIALGGTFLFVSFALLVAMGLAGVARRWWWALAAPLFTGLALLFTFVGVYLVPNTHALENPALVADSRALAAEEGVPHTKVLVQEIHRQVTAPNAESAGFGPTRRVILWDTLLDGRFSRREVDIVIAHELGHIAHHHQLKRVGWLALFLFPATALVAWLTRRRGGLGRPEAVPLALFVFVALQVLTLPLSNFVSRHEEAEADWSALRATRAPLVAERLFEKLATASREDPDPPSWSYLLFANHPSITQRVAMVRAFAQLREGRSLP